MDSVASLIYLLFVHWVADFVCQTDNMAKNKSNNFNYLLLHIAEYTGVFTFLTGAWFAPEFIIINCAAHLLIDYATSKLNSYLWQKQQIHYFFVSIGFDQLLHLSLMVYTLWLFY